VISAFIQTASGILPNLFKFLMGCFYPESGMKAVKTGFCIKKEAVCIIEAFRHPDLVALQHAE